MVARRLPAPVALLVLLIDHDDAQVLERCEQRRPGTDHHIDLSAPRPFELVRSLARTHFRMDDGNPVSESVVKPHQCLVGQCDLGDQHNCLLTMFHREGDQLNIDLRLPGPGHAPDQVSSRRLLFPGAADCADDLLLLCIQRDTLVRKGLRQLRGPVCILALDPNEPFLRQRPDNRRRYVQLLRDNLPGKGLFLRKCRQKPLACLLLLHPADGRCTPGSICRNRQRHPLLLANLHLCFFGKNRAERLQEGTAIPVPDPDRQPGQPALLACRLIVNPRERPDFFLLNLRCIREPHNIAGHHPFSERNRDKRADITAAGEFLRHPVLKAPVQRMGGNIHNHICEPHSPPDSSARTVTCACLFHPLRGCHGSAPAHPSGISSR